jgi:glycosyltransferase involved in cell wall biosynthesis
VCLEWVKRRVARKADLNIVQGRDLAARLPQHMMATYSVSSERILPVPNGIALELIRPSAVERDDRAPFTVFYVGYVSQLRGIDTLLQAFALLRRQVPAARLVLAGWAKHDDRAWLDAEIERLGLKGSVQYLGELPSEQVWEQIQESDCCVHPFSADHLSYVYPVKVFEYLALERPVVASRLEGISAIIEDGKNGLLANPGDADDWARALITLASDVSLRKKLMRNARSSIERYSWRRIHSQIHAAIAARASVLLTHPDAADRK